MEEYNPDPEAPLYPLKMMAKDRKQFWPQVQYVGWSNLVNLNLLPMMHLTPRIVLCCVALMLCRSFAISI